MNVLSGTSESDARCHRMYFSATGRCISQDTRAMTGTEGVRGRQRAQPWAKSTNRGLSLYIKVATSVNIEYTFAVRVFLAFSREKREYVKFRLPSWLNTPAAI